MTTNAENRGANLHFFDGSTHERQDVMSAVRFVEDFVGPATMSIPAFTVATNLPWGKHIVGSATVAKKADQACGVVELALTSASEAQTGSLNQKNERNFSVEKGLVFESRVRATVLPTGSVVGFVGLGSDYSADPEAMTYLAGFSFRASGVINIECDDNATDTSAASGVTVSANEWVTLRIEFLESGTAYFYINGNSVGSAPYAATGANAILQPVAQLYKASSTPVGTLEVDYIKVFTNR